jgi:hypothetical protein
MTSALVSSRRRGAAAVGQLISEDQAEGELSLGREFPSSATVVEDRQLGVLLGRQVFWTHTQKFFGVLSMNFSALLIL